MIIIPLCGPELTAEAGLSLVELVSWGQVWQKTRQFVTPGDPEYAEAGQTYFHFELKASLG